MKEKSKKIAFSHPLYDKIIDDDTDITAIYIRVSTDSQAQDGYGIDVQYGAIKRYLDAYDVKNAFVFIDDGYTGMNEFRPAFSKMSQLMKEGRIKFVITYSLDRIGRTQMIILRFLKEQCETAKCDFFAVKDNVDSRSRQTYGILVSILSIFAEFDHDAIVSKLANGRIQRASEGYWKGGGTPPYGYRYSPEENALLIVEEQAEKVRKAFEIYNTSEISPKKIADFLGFSSDVAVFNILRNRIYIGEVYYRGESYKGRHTPIIDEKTFDLTQEILKRKSITRGRGVYLLSSLLYCGVCGSKMRYMKWGKSVKIFCYSRFAESTKKSLVKDENCDNKIYDAEEIEEEVVKTVLAFAVEYGEEKTKKPTEKEEIINGLKFAKERAETEYSRLLNAYKKIGDENILEAASETKKRIKKIERDIADEQEKRILTERSAEKAKIMRTLPSTWEVMNFSQRQRVIRGLVEKIVVSPNGLNVYLRKGEYEKITEENPR